MRDEQTHDKHILTVVTAGGWRRFRRGLFARTSWVGMVVILVLGHGAASLAGPLDDAGSNAVVRFEPLPTPPPILDGRLL